MPLRSTKPISDPRRKTLPADFPRRSSARTSKRILISDTAPTLLPNRRLGKPVVETARNKVRNEIAAVTKPKRDAFLLAHKDYFLPLLPPNNYIRKLEKQNDSNAVEHVPYSSLASQPAGVEANMKPYQLEGLSFLVHMHNNGMSAILGDEMGLGKTLQTLSLFQYLVENKAASGESRPSLVVCPLSVLSSWMAEAKRWVPHLHVVRFHGPKVEREKIRQSSHERRTFRPDLFITTYEAFLTDQAWFKRAFVWRYCVLDEGHKVKNSSSNVSTALHGLSAEFRLLLTGTPIQNNLTEMWGLLHWLVPEVFTADTAENFKNAFDLTKGKASTTFMDDARQLLEIVMLRRMKNSPGVNLGLPPKEEILLYVPLTPMQRFWYQRLLTRTDAATLDGLFSHIKEKEIRSLAQEAAEPHTYQDVKDSHTYQDVKDSHTYQNVKDSDDSEVWAESKAIIEQSIRADQDTEDKSSWRKLMNLLMQLRKVCVHPYVLPNAAPQNYLIGEHIKTASGKFIVLDKLLDELVVKEGKKVIIFSGFTRVLDLCEDLLLLKGANSNDGSFRYARLDGSTSRAHRNLSIRLFNGMHGINSADDSRVMLLSTRAGGLGINLTSATEVIFLDEDWNPQMSLQAEARAHRIGQTRKVTIYKLCSQGTVEEQMMGRIRKKLYLSTKITESMRNIHSQGAQSKKRKRQSTTEAAEDDGPQLDTSSLQSLIRRGAQTLARPQIDVTEMLSWDWETALEKCKDRPIDVHVNDESGPVDEEAWLNQMERVQCAVFEGKRHQKELDAKAKASSNEPLNRADRRQGKNTTVEVDGFMINKESLLCADWEAVPTLGGKDPSLAEPKREKRAKIDHQSHCQCCWDGGEVVVCAGCPRVYHRDCLDKETRVRAQGITFYCPQHQCRDCGGKTAEAGGLIYRCRWCENGFCEDCLDWTTVKLLGPTLPEYDMLGTPINQHAYFVECSHCIEHWKANPKDGRAIDKERVRIEGEYKVFLNGTLAEPDAKRICLTTV